jgi:hypothetical protein
MEYNCKFSTIWRALTEISKVMLSLNDFHCFAVNGENKNNMTEVSFLVVVTRRSPLTK